MTGQSRQLSISLHILLGLGEPLPMAMLILCTNSVSQVGKGHLSSVARCELEL